jgi:hypothetical protein
MGQVFQVKHDFALQLFGGCEQYIKGKGIASNDLRRWGEDQSDLQVTFPVY